MNTDNPKIKFRVVNNISFEIKKYINAYQTGDVYIFVDQNTKRECLPVLSGDMKFPDKNIIEIKSGENNKSMDTAIFMWDYLSRNGVKRNSLVINIGGGMLCDLGAFVASTIKRGIKYINVPTTLLAMIDAAIGGKAGLNFNGLKNEIGLIQQPEDVIIDVRFLKTLNKENLLSGLGEMLKYGLIFDAEQWNRLISFNLDELDYKQLEGLINESALIKKYFVEKDPFEKDIRKALNFGHTFGHAFESYSIKTRLPLLHGKAIAYGMICESYLSNKEAGLSSASFDSICSFIINTFGKPAISKNNFKQYLDLMKYDKKNTDNKINCTLIPEIGQFSINNCFSSNEILKALDFLVKI